MKFKNNLIEINGRNIFYLEKGQGSKGTIVLLHGFPGNHQCLVDLARGIGDGYRFVVPDLPACGKTSPLTEQHLLKNYAKWLDEFLKAVDVHQPIIVGHSFGSRVALVFASEYPDVAKRLVLITPVVGLYGIIPRIASLKGQIAKMLPAYMQKKWLTNSLYQYAVKMIIFKSASARRRQELTDRDTEESKNINVNATIEIFDEFYSFNLIPIGRHIRTRTLVIAGQKDEVATLASVQHLVQVIPNSELRVIELAGHLVPLEKPKSTAKIIKSWLDTSFV